MYQSVHFKIESSPREADIQILRAVREGAMTADLEYLETSHRLGEGTPLWEEIYFPNYV